MANSYDPLSGYDPEALKKSTEQPTTPPSPAPASISDSLYKPVQGTSPYDQYLDWRGREIDRRAAARMRDFGEAEDIALWNASKQVESEGAASGAAIRATPPAEGTSTADVNPIAPSPGQAVGLTPYARARVDWHNRQVEKEASGPPREEDVAELDAMNAAKHRQVGGGDARSPLEKQLEADYGEQLGGMQEESDARVNEANVGAGALREKAAEERAYAQDSADQAHGYAQEAREHLDMIGGLAQDYAAGQIDKELWWKEKSVPQKFATVLGAMFAGLGGGVRGAMDFVNGQVDRSIQIQMKEQEYKGRGLYEADNLFNNFLKVSHNEQEAYDKTRAAMLDAAMTEVAAAGAEAKAPIERAQMKQFMAALKMQRDTILAKLAAARQGAAAAGAQQVGWLAVDPKTLVQGPDGQAYIIQNPQLGDDITNAVTALQTIKGLIRQGDAILAARHSITDYAPYSASIQQGETVDSSMVEALSKLASARGVPTSILKTVREQVPTYGSRAAGIEAPKSGAMQQYLDQRTQEIIHQAGAVPVETRIAGGAGKKAGELTYYVRPGVTAHGGQEQAAKRRYSTFQPGR